MIKKIKYLLVLVPIFLAFDTDVYAVNVDIYVAMETGNDGEVLTSEIMEASSHGGIAGLPDPDWLLFSGNDCRRSGCPGDSSRDMWASTEYVRALPGTVTVKGVTYSGRGTRTWKFSDLYRWNFVDIRYGEDREKRHPPPYHPRTTIASFYTPNIDQWEGFGCTFDTYILPCHNSYSVLQTIGGDDIPEPPGMYIRAHGSKENWVPTLSDIVIPVEPGKTYWVNLHYDGPAEVTKIAVFDPDNEYAQVGDISVAESIAWDGYGAESRVAFGRADHHSDLGEWWDETFSYFSHIMIDYTEGKFPLLPDNVVQIKNLNLKKSSINPQMMIHPNPSRGKCTIQLSKISPAATIGNKLRIYDLSGNLVDELNLRDGKFLWNNNSISTGTYLMRLEGNRNYLNQKLLLIR